MPQSAEHKKIRKLLESITNKRARIMIEHILENGFVTTEQLEKQYGYNHPPRAARDVREFGIPLETFRVKDSAGRSIAASPICERSLPRLRSVQCLQTYSLQFTRLSLFRGVFNNPLLFPRFIEMIRLC